MQGEVISESAFVKFSDDKLHAFIQYHELLVGKQFQLLLLKHHFIVADK